MWRSTCEEKEITLNMLSRFEAERRMCEHPCKIARRRRASTYVCLTICNRPLYVSCVCTIVHKHAYVSGIVVERSVVTKDVSNVQHCNARYRELHAWFSRMVPAIVIHCCDWTRWRKGSGLIICQNRKENFRHLPLAFANTRHSEWRLNKVRELQVSTLVELSVRLVSWHEQVHATSCRMWKSGGRPSPTLVVAKTLENNATARWSNFLDQSLTFTSECNQRSLVRLLVRGSCRDTVSTAECLSAVDKPALSDLDTAPNTPWHPRVWLQALLRCVGLAVGKSTESCSSSFHSNRSYSISSCLWAAPCVSAVLGLRATLGHFLLWHEMGLQGSEWPSVRCFLQSHHTRIRIDLSSLVDLPKQHIEQVTNIGFLNVL